MEKKEGWGGGGRSRMSEGGLIAELELCVSMLVLLWYTFNLCTLPKTEQRSQHKRNSEKSGECELLVDE
jgi:hypothetical protein